VGKGIVGGVMMPHAPQFFTLPETEDKATVDRVKQAAETIGRALEAHNPDVWIILANDHVNQFFLHATPPFTIHLGAEAKGSFAGRDFGWPIPSDAALDITKRLYRDGFDVAFTNTAKIDYAFGIPLTFLNVNRPILPVYVNSYVPPQPTPERCYAFGQALARVVKEAGLTAVVTASGGMSHYPGTDQYSQPMVDFDRALTDRFAEGNLRAMLAYDEDALDRTGNVELRSWMVAAGMLGERKPDLVSFEPSWHHTYVTLGFWKADDPSAKEKAHYPHVYGHLVGLTAALHRLAHDPEAQQAFIDDPKAFAAALDLPGDQKAALAELDEKKLGEIGVHPLVPFLARMTVSRLKQARQQTK